MSNPLFTVMSGLKMLGKFYTSDSSPFSTEDKEQICKHLGVAFEEAIRFEPTAYSKSDAKIGKRPDYTNKKERKFWIYKPGAEP